MIEVAIKFKGKYYKSVPHIGTGKCKLCDARSNNFCLELASSLGSGAICAQLDKHRKSTDGSCIYFKEVTP